MSGSISDLVVQLDGMDRDDFEATVVAVSKGRAGEQILEALCSDLGLAERWLAILRRMIRRNQRALDNPSVVDRKGEDWARRTQKFIEALHDEVIVAEMVTGRLRRTHEVEALRRRCGRLERENAELRRLIEKLDAGDGLSIEQEELLSEILGEG